MDVLILPPGHGEMVRARPALGRRERRIVAAVAGLAVVIAAVAIGASVFSSSPTAAGCVDATVPGPIGATVFHECGADARHLCTTLAPGTDMSAYGLAVLGTACRKSGLKVPAGIGQ